MSTATGTRSPYNHWCCKGCDGSKPLTLADRELITGRSMTQLDEETGVEFCVDCLADLPADGYEALFHVCGEPEQASESGPPVVHKTRTTQPAGYVQDDAGIRRFDKRGRVMYDRGSFALCSCGWVAAGATREEARSSARAHRQEFATTREAATR
ncbi:MAG TPA: hypothetical protein VFB06_11620 [Streptosporangiaceae bacterium]|nr:hypothetical protein [Streptosporangiaceae bacterium]